MSKHISLFFALVYILIAALSVYCLPAADGRVDEVTVTVNTTNGQVRGHRAYTWFRQKLFYAFRGIPYGQPPAGPLRFKPPLPALPWNGVLDAEKNGNICVQPDGGSEDCLFLNVFTPNVSPQEKLPVFIDIHGGAFVLGSLNEHEPDFLFNEGDFVMVSMNYRLGPFGFLTLGTPEYSGNMALKDQQLSMKWVVDNIENFGGDPNRITLYGISAGAVCAHDHVLAESSNKFFQRAIVVSGSSIAPWATTTENHLTRSRIFAEQNGIFTNDTNQIISFLESADTSLFFASGSAMLPGLLEDSLASNDLTWTPVLEPEGTVNPILQQSLSDVLENNFSTHVDTLFAVASEESLFMLGAEMYYPELLQPLNATFRTQFPLYAINQKYDFASAEFSQILAEIRNYYFGNQDIDARTIPNLASLRSDIMFNYNVERSARLHAGASNANTYLYRFSVDGAASFMKSQTLGHAYGIIGATHGDDSFHVFRAPTEIMSTIYSLLHETSVERLTIERIAKAYVSFIVDGTPAGYLPVQPNNVNFIDYTNNGVIVGTNPFSERIIFWNNLIQRYGLL